MKTIAMLALVAGGLGLSAPAASAAALNPGLSPALAASNGVTKICGCNDRVTAPAGFYGGFVDTPNNRPYVNGYTSSFVPYTARYGDGAAPPYASFPDRRRVYRMWGWWRTYADPVPVD